MSEIYKDVKTIKVYMQCNVCEEGSMIPTGSVRMSSPPQYEHRCSHCDEVACYHVRYPEIRYVEVVS